jgi:hypothetical protein
MSVTASPPPHRPRLPAVPPPLAEKARTAPGGRPLCAVCARPIEPGEREARLPAGWAHMFPCVVAGAGSRA